MSDTLQIENAAAAAAFLTAALPYNPVSERRIRRHLFEHPGFEPEWARTIRDTNGNLLSLVAALRLPDDAEGRPQAQLVAMATRADRRRQGLARRLYAELEVLLRGGGIADILVRGGGTLCSGLDLRYQAATTMLLRRLYTPIQVAYDMTLDPEQPIPPPPPVQGFVCRPLVPAEAPLLRSLCEKEFTGWLFAEQLIRPGEPCGVIGAFTPDGRLAAFAAWSEYIFGPTGTAEEFRRRGLGSAVFWDAVNAMRDAGFAQDIIIGAAHFSYYARAFGCHIRNTLWRMSKNIGRVQEISKGKSRETA